MLTLPEREKSKKEPSNKSCGRILTSLENIIAIEEKEQNKKEKARLKEERKHVLERKRAEKAKLAAEKKQKIEAKKTERARNMKERSHLQDHKKPTKTKWHMTKDSMVKVSLLPRKKSSSSKQDMIMDTI